MRRGVGGQSILCKLFAVGLFTAFFFSVLIAQTDGMIKGGGSGFIVDPEGYILTNYHVIEGAETITVYVDGHAYQPTVVAIAEASDLALLKIPASGLTSVALGNSLLVQLLDPVVAMGYPLPQYGRDLSVSEGKITAIRTNVEGREGKDTLQHDAVITHGSSGGPLFNMMGEVIGVNFGGVEGSGLQFAIPINEAVPLLRNIPGFNPATMGTATETLPPREIVARYRSPVVYIEISIRFSWYELLPDPESIPGFPNEAIEIPSGLVLDDVSDWTAWLRGFGFHLTTSVGISGTNGHWGNKIYLFVFENSQEASQAAAILVQNTPPTSPCQTEWELGLGARPITLAGLQGFYSLHSYSVFCLPTRYAAMDGRIALYLGQLVFFVKLSWSTDATTELGIDWEYRDGYLVEITHSNLIGVGERIRRLIKAEEVMQSLQELAALVALTARNKLGE